MPPANNRRAFNLAKQNDWYCRFDPELNDSVTCDPSDPDAHVDMIRGFEAIRHGDSGPRTPETIRARREYNLAHPKSTAP